MVGLNWNDALLKATNWVLGLALSSYATEKKGQSVDAITMHFAIEASTTTSVTDNITITPAVFWTNANYASDGDDTFGGLSRQHSNSDLRF